MARSTHDGALGRARSGRREGDRSGSRARIQGCVPDAQSAHRHFQRLAHPLDRSTDIAKEVQRNRPNVKRLTAEFLGTAFLLAGVVGSGVMAAKLAGGNGALALLCNTLPTGAILTVLILTFGPVSGAHFNPAVSIAFTLRGELPIR